MVRAAFVLSFLLLVGCEDGSRADSRTLDVDDPEFRQGQTFHKQGEVRKALECFLKVIDNRKGAAESHLEAGRMYLELQDPLPAIYHFNQYIRMKPTSEQSNIVRQMVKTAEKQFMQQLPGRPMEPDALGGADLTARDAASKGTSREALFAAGEKIYRAYCVGCHQPDGRGVPGGAANFADDRTRLAKEDAALLAIIEQGNEAKGMPAFEAILSPIQRRAALAYVRAAFGPGPQQ